MASIYELTGAFNALWNLMEEGTIDDEVLQESSTIRRKNSRSSWKVTANLSATLNPTLQDSKRKKRDLQRREG